MIDLAKISGREYWDFLRRIFSGTPGGTLLKILGAMIGILVVVGGLGYGVGGKFPHLGDSAAEVPQQPSKQPDEHAKVPVIVDKSHGLELTETIPHAVRMSLC